MNAISIVLDVDRNPPLAGRDPAQTIRISDGITFARIPRGMTSGKSAVGITAVLPDGRAVFLETSMQNFLGVARAFISAEHSVLESN